MNEVSDILQFRFSKTSFEEKGINIIPSHVVNLCQYRISTLNAITEKIGNSMLDEKPTKGIREVYLKFLRICQSDHDFIGKFDKRELKTLTYALTYKEYQEKTIYENPEYLKYCLSLLNDNWRDSFISGLLDCYLSNWGISNKESFNVFSEFLTRKISDYRGTRSLFKSLKTNAKFFDKNKGDLDLGATLAISKKQISEATKFLSLPDHWITYPYFAGVINAFCEKSKNNLENVLEDIALTLEAHSYSVKATRTNKLVVSKIICQSETASEILQNKVKDIALKLVGDPTQTSMWRLHETASLNEITTVNKARGILNEWVTRQFISVFFEKCINDYRRKHFWLQYSKKISQFKVFGPSHIKKLLKSDERISEYVDGRFKSVYSSKDVSAFMFLIGDYRLIEFSDPGYAFYAYKSSNTKAPSFDDKHVSSADDFRDGRMPMLVYRSGYHLHSFSEEGRLSHNDGDMKWEDVFSTWLHKIAGIND